jgi:HSP20 family molecular chaperone IbpA
MPLDIYESPTKYTIVAQVAGIPKEKIEVELEGKFI